MTDQFATFDAAILQHRCLFQPWTDPPQLDLLPDYARHLRDDLGLSITVVTRTLPSVPAVLAGLPDVEVLTKARSTRFKPGQRPHRHEVVLAHFPTPQLAAIATALPADLLLISEWKTDPMRGWATQLEAFDVVAGSPTPGLTPEARKILAELMFAGYNSWHDDIARRQAMDAFRALHDLGEYDRDVVLAEAWKTKGRLGIANLTKLVDQADADLAVNRV